MRRRILTDDGGWNLVELMVASALSLVLLTGLAATLISAMRVGQFGSAQSVSLDGARQVLNQVGRDLRGSKGFETCVQPGDPAGSCVLLTVQPPAGDDQLVRYRLIGDRLTREIDDGTGTFAAVSELSDRLVNHTQDPPVPLFECVGTSGLLQVAVRMVVQPVPASSPSYDLETSVRPRNSYQPSSC